MQHVCVATDAFLVVGIRTRTTNRIEADPQMARIPVLWRRFHDEEVPSKIPDRLPDSDIIAVYTDYDSELRAAYTLVVGHKVRTLDRSPKGMEGVIVPTARYLRFTATGPQPQFLIAAWTAIWQFFERSHEYERAFTTDYEVHRRDEVEIYVAVRRFVGKDEG
jgi:predicted transcriptional regulator YdeE